MVLVKSCANLSICLKQSAAKLQQSVQALPSVPLTPYMSFPSKPQLPVRFPVLCGPKGDGSMIPITKPSDCKNVIGGLQDSKDLVPVSTLDHIAKIQCPVVSKF